ncbi:MAG TPA: hypothetical protein VEH06_05495 [Candidatus Bathyarchaeia archaeon]|nr:hypothetical protein [Candidatus Bathyarchaeia archaeon]
MTEHQQDKINENIPARPQKLELKLLEKRHEKALASGFRYSKRKN